MLQAGFEAAARGNWPRAAAVCKEALALRPDLPRAHYLAGLVAKHGGDLEMALQAFETTVKLNEKHAAAWAHLAQLYVATGRIRRAEASLKNAANFEKGNAATRNHIGTVFRLAGNLEASLEWHEKAVEADPGQLPFLMNLANAHLYTGDREKCAELLRACLDIEPMNAQLHWLLARLAKAESTRHIEEMAKLADPHLPGRERAYLHYAIGKEHEDLGNWDVAFEAWLAGAAARRESVAYDENSEIELFETLESTFTCEWLEAAQGDCFDAGPVFIVGLPRTGTTLLDRMLDAHDAVSSAGELRHFGFAVRQVTGLAERRQFSAALMRAAAGADASAVGEAYVEMTASLRGDSPHVIDKLPSNFLCLPLIFAALPNARIIHMRRGPMDTCLAIFKQLFADAYLYSYDLEELARHYQRYAKLMNAWRERFGDRFIEVEYETLVADPEETLRTVLQYVGLSWEPRCLEYFDVAGGTATASAAQVREAPHQRSVGHWKHFERQLEPVRKILGDS